MAYVPLALPTITATGTDSNGNLMVTLKDAATWLTEAAKAIAVTSDSFINTLSDLNTIDFSSIGDLPDFDSVIPGLNMTAPQPTRPTVDLDLTVLQSQLAALTVPIAPSANFSYNETGYNSGLRDPMIAKLLNDLLYGGYGIDTNDEVTLWNRERDREALLAQANIEEVKRQAASTSFPMPQGAMYAALQKARQEYMAKNSSVNRDIGLERSKLYVLNRQATLEKVLASEEQSIKLYNAVQDRLLEAAKVTVTMAVALFDAGYKYFQGQLASVQAQIEAKVTAEKMRVELYQADIGKYVADVNGIVASSRVVVDLLGLRQNRDKIKYMGDVEKVRFRLEQLKATTENMKNINQFSAEFFRTGLGTAMAGIQGQTVQNVSP